MSSVYDIWDTGVEIIFEQWKVLLEETDDEELFWDEIDEFGVDIIRGFEQWLEEQA